MRTVTPTATGWRSAGPNQDRAPGRTHTRVIPATVDGSTTFCRHEGVTTDPNWGWREEDAAPGPVRRIKP